MKVIMLAHILAESVW